MLLLKLVARGNCFSLLESGSKRATNLSLQQSSPLKEKDGKILETKTLA